MKQTVRWILCVLAVLPAACVVEQYGLPEPENDSDQRSVQRDRLFASYASEGAGVCERWNQLDRSQRALFLTVTDRLHKSQSPDGLTMLDHVDGVALILGGGDSGRECGGTENNRLFMTMDAYLWERMVESRRNAGVLSDGAGSVWQNTSDIAGPHAPFTASIETNSGLRCASVVEMPESRPPTAQAHFFLDGDAVAVERGPHIALPAHPYLFEIDLDFDCFHDSNPVCPGSDYEQRYLEQYGDYDCGWVPAGCAPVGEGCYRDAVTDPALDT